MDDDFNAVVEFFAGDNGLATRLEGMLGTYLGSNGLISQREESLNSELNDINEERADLNVEMQQYEDRLRAKYGAMDLVVAELNSTSAFLSQQLATLPGFTRTSSE